MPRTEDARIYAESALSQGKSALTLVSSTLASATGRLANFIDEAPRPGYLALGVADIAAERISRRAEAATRRVEHLPADAVASYARAQSTAKTRMTKRQEDAVNAISKAQEEALAGLGKLREGFQAHRPAPPSLPKVDPAAARAAARQNTEAYLGAAKSAYTAVNSRGETRAAQLRQDERLGRFIDEFDSAAATVQSKVGPLLLGISAKLEAAVGRVARTAPAQAASSPNARAASTTVEAPAKKASAQKSPAQKPTAKKAPPAKAPAAKAPAKAAAKAPAKKAPVKAAPVKAAPVKAAPAKKAP